MNLPRLIGTLQAAATKDDLRGPLVAIARGDGELDVRVPPEGVLRSSLAFFTVMRAGLREAEARAVGLLLPVRTVAGEERPCSYPDAEAWALVAVERFDEGVGVVGMRCPLHALPSGWEEAHDRQESIAQPLTCALLDKPLDDERLAS